MKIFLIITFVIAFVIVIFSTTWVILLGFKRKNLNKPYHIKEYQEIIKKENAANGKISLKDQFKLESDSESDKELKTELKSNTDSSKEGVLKHEKK